MLPFITQAAKPSIKSEIVFKGYNGTQNIKTGDMPYMKNLCSDNAPAASPRPPREIIATLTSPQTLSSANSKLIYVDGTDFKYDSTTKGTVTAGKKCMVDFNNNILIFPDKKYYSITNDVFGDIGTGAYPAAGSCPDIDYAVALNNRVWGCKDNHIYASALGNFKDWTTLGTGNADAFAVDVASEGKFVGISNYLNHVQFFKVDVMHEQYGDKPSNFQIQQALKKGALSHDSICEMGGLLYSLWRDGVNCYGGGQPMLVSVELGKTYANGAAATDGRKYYLSLYDGSRYDLFVYDSIYRVWHREENLRVIQFTAIDGVVYALCADGKLLKFNSGDEQVEWELYTEVFSENYTGKKGYSWIGVRAELEQGSSLSVYVKVDNFDWKLIKTHDSAYSRLITVPITVPRAEIFQIKIAGKGKAKVHQIDRKFFYESDR
ncbi:MAG: hypothetical protein PHE79_08600 [Eubacteriales bacterium]|nr:hypothetical protein [Eubacteriales bacterium]